MHRNLRPVSLVVVMLAGVVTLAACSRASRLNLRCMAGDVQRCGQLGDMYASGSGVRQDYGRAAGLYEKVCDAGVAEMCNRVGEIYEHVPGFESEAGRVASFYERACNGNSAIGCLNLGLLRVADEQFEQAAALFERACAGGEPAGCHRLGLALEEGQGVLKDVPRAVNVLEQACDSQHAESCSHLALLFTQGTLVEADPARVSRYNTQLVRIYSDGCDAGVARDCQNRDALLARLAAIGR